MMIFETEFINKTKHVVRAWENGRILLKVPPGKSAKIESNSAETIYAPYEKLVFLESGEIKTTKNKDWVFSHPNAVALEVFNQDGAPWEGFYLSPTNLINAPKGIPIFVPVDISSNLAFVKRMTYRMETKEVCDADGFISEEKRFIWKKEPRSDTEMDELERRRREAALVKEKKDADERHLVKPQEEKSGD